MIVEINIISDSQTTKASRADLIAWLTELDEITSDEAGMIQATIDRLRDDAEYKCVGAHDLCHTMTPCKECPGCQFMD
jgi:hypothetical protein